MKLRDAHILVIVPGDGRTLGEEIVKNLALAGIGKLSILHYNDNCESSCRSIRGDDKSLAAYAEALNPHIQVQSSSSVEPRGMAPTQIASFSLSLSRLRNDLADTEKSGEDLPAR